MVKWQRLLCWLQRESAPQSIKKTNGKQNPLSFDRFQDAYHSQAILGRKERNSSPLTLYRTTAHAIMRPSRGCEIALNSRRVQPPVPRACLLQPFVCAGPASPGLVLNHWRGESTQQICCYETSQMGNCIIRFGIECPCSTLFLSGSTPALD